MRGAGPYAATSIARMLVFFAAAVFGTVAYSGLATRPVESQQAPAQPLYEVHDLGTLGVSGSGATGINDANQVIGITNIAGDPDEHAFLLTPHFDGFYQPVDNLPTLNKTKPGKTIPVRFSLGGDRGLDIFADGYPRSEVVPCDSSATVDGIEETTTGKGGLSYNASTERYEYAWATGGTWSGCRQFVLKLKDGSVHRANFICR